MICGGINEEEKETFISDHPKFFVPWSSTKERCPVGRASLIVLVRFGGVLSTERAFLCLVDVTSPQAEILLDEDNLRQRVSRSRLEFSSTSGPDGGRDVGILRPVRHASFWKESGS